MSISTKISNMVTLLTNVKGSPFIGLTYEKTVKTLKKDRDTKEPFLGVVTKITTLNAKIGTDYETSAVNRLAKVNQEYVRGLTTNHIEYFGEKRIVGTTSKGKTIVSIFVNDKTKFISTYFLDGKEIDKKSLPNVLPKSSDRTNYFLTVGMDLIKSMTINKEKYTLV